MSKTHWRTFHPTKYVGSQDFDENEEKIVTIDRAEHEKVEAEKGRSDDCLVVHFKEREVKPLIVNVTNSKAIAKVSGSHYIEDWAGTRIALFTMPVSAFGEQVMAVRVRQTAPKVSKPRMNPDHPKWEEVISKIQSGAATIGTVEKHYLLSGVARTMLEEAAGADA